MPLYEYECEACGNRFERIQKFSDPPVGECPKCGGVVRKLISSPAIQFKGSGWYVTDYAKKAEKSDGPGSSGSETGTGSASGTAETGGSKTEPAAKEPAKDSPKPAAEKATPGSKT
jgi:putative FmdB family regulatory protein